MRKPLFGLLKGLGILLAIAFLLVAVGSVTLVITARYDKDHVPTAFGWKVLTIEGWSMRPALESGDLVGLRPLAPGEVAKEGDMITFRQQGAESLLVTHRVAGIVKVNGKPTFYVTKGDFNTSADLTTVALTSVIGRVEWQVPYLGFVVRFVQRPAGLVSLVLLPTLLLLVLLLVQAHRIMSAADAAQKTRKADGETEQSPAAS